MTIAEAIKRLETCDDCGDCLTCKAHDEAIEVAVTALKEQDVTDKNVGNKWISVSERLPKSIINKVLVHCKNGYIGFGHYEEFQGVKDWYNLESGEPFREWDLEDCETYEVTHWMPLPEPPKEEV